MGKSNQVQLVTFGRKREIVGSKDKITGNAKTQFFTNLQSKLLWINCFSLPFLYLQLTSKQVIFGARFAFERGRGSWGSVSVFRIEVTPLTIVV